MARRRTVVADAVEAATAMSAEVEVENKAVDSATEDKPLSNPVFVRKAEQEPEVKHVASSDLVCVALNRPYGVFFRMPDGRKVKLNGNGEALIGKEKGILPVGAYGMTMIAREDWEYICKTYGDYALFKNGLCFAANKQKDAEKEADSRDDLRNGLEPVDTKNTKTTEAKGE